ncbi:MAG: PDZ domain-containing protein [Dehalococcoidia bacterium]
MPRSRRRSLWLLIPFWFFFVMLCLVAPLATGLGLRSQVGAGSFLGGLAGGSQPWIGIRMRPVTADAANVLGLPNTDGAIVDRIYPTSPADQGGLELYDVIVSVNGRPVTNVDSVSGALSSLRPGSAVEMTVLRPNPTGRGAPTTQALTLVAGQRPRVGEVRGWVDYRSADVPYQFRYPNTWFIDDIGAPAEPILLAPPTPYDDVVQFQVSANVPALDEWYRLVIESARSGAVDLKVANERQVTVAGQTGRRATLSLVGESNETRQIEIALARDPANSRGYFVFLAADPASFPDLLPNFEEILASLTISR